MKNITMAAALFSAFFLGAQEVKISKEVISINGQAVLKYEKINFSEYSLYDNAGEEVLNLQFKDSGTENSSDDFMLLNFIGQGHKIKSGNLERISAAGSKGMIVKLITWLAREKVIDAAGNIDRTQLIPFVQKYGSEL